MQRGSTQREILEVINRYGPSSNLMIRSVGPLSAPSASTAVSQALRRMLRAGLIEKRPDGYYQLTPVGVAQLEECRGWDAE